MAVAIWLAAARTWSKERVESVVSLGRLLGEQPASTSRTRVSTPANTAGVAPGVRHAVTSDRDAGGDKAASSRPLAPGP